MKPDPKTVTINLPHLCTPDLVAAVLPLWLNQSVPTVIDVVDTGSNPNDFDELKRICLAHSPRVRLHVINPRRKNHPSEIIAIACELSQLYADTEKVLWSHVDVFPRRRDLVETWSQLCGRHQPVVGYEMSSRSHVGGWIGRNWKGIVGHSLTIGHLPTLRANRIRWGFAGTAEEFALSAEDLRFWDTEVTFGLCLQRAGIKPLFVGRDVNYEHLIDEWHGHARSYPGSVVSGSQHLQVAKKWKEIEVAAVPGRLKEWKVSHA